MQNNIKSKMQLLKEKATKRKLSCPNIKTKDDVSFETECFNHLKKDLYNHIGGNKR